LNGRHIKAGGNPHKIQGRCIRKTKYDIPNDERGVSDLVEINVIGLEASQAPIACSFDAVLVKAARGLW
jgi:hypothetical protein